jgi:DNA mismatch repair protein MSH3
VAWNQVGSFVPADELHMGVFDNVFTRMGAEDFIAQGRSTFMVELQEASDILVRATSRSLIIMDELGRGTSTHDGTAIAYATLKTLVQDVAAFTLFVTHYQLICQLQAELPAQVLPPASSGVRAGSLCPCLVEDVLSSQRWAPLELGE